jgi:predicted GH43/DUF377 family glycosyl hydrolase
MHRSEAYLTRHPANPLLRPEQVPGAEALMNGCPFVFEDRIHLLQPIIWRDREFPSMHVCESDDGVNFRIRPEPFIQHQPREERDPLFHLDRWAIDPRVTRIGDTYYIMRPGDSYLGTVALLGRTKDWKTYEHMEIVSLPMNRVPCLFPEKIGGDYVRLDRPSGRREGDIWLARSPDLIHWGRHRPLAQAGFHWCNKKIGPSVPIATPEGWLVLIHGVQDSCAGSRYSLGAMLLDRQDPERIIGRMKSWILTPDRDYEFQGNVPNVVFVCGALAFPERDELRVYYGAADTCMGLATGSLSRLIDACRKEA